MRQSGKFPFPRERTIGILGGGQLGRMLAIAAGRLGFSTIILDPMENCPAAQFANQQIVAQYDDRPALQKLAEHSFVTTYEFENIPVSSARALEKTVNIFPGAVALETSQDRLTEKQFIQNAGLNTARFVAVSDKSQLDVAIGSIGLPAILKTRRLGYDGKGQIRLESANPVDLPGQIEAILQTECILEAMVDFDSEISVIGARSANRQTAIYDPARNTHENGILVDSQVPCGHPGTIVEEAKQQTINLMEKLDYVGVIGVEFFVTKSGKLLINEFAPRVHNSGHWTEAACMISQFEQHIRAITGLPLGSTTRHSDCWMQNLIGDSIKELSTLATTPDTLIHHYGKQEIREGRKMGHFTTLYDKI
jgi:5-(carboxyamino)imidazole ribonucleotide synthase